MRMAGPWMSHIFYADDVLLVVRATTKDCICIKAILKTYYLMFGQAMNVTTSYVTFSPSILRMTKRAICAVLQIAEKKRIWRYLGVPLSRERLTATDFHFLKEKTTNRIKS